jgi:hypothetical protein
MVTHKVQPRHQADYLSALLERDSHTSDDEASVGIVQHCSGHRQEIITQETSK